MSIASELTALANNKAAIKAAIEAKNPSVAPTDALAQWPTSIASIGGGGGGDAHYALVSITPTYTTTTTTNDTAAVTLLDNTINVVEVADTATSLTFTFPEAVSGRARDFIVRLTILGSTPPTIYFIADGGSAVDPSDTNTLFDATDYDWYAVVQGVNILMFTETALPAPAVNS